MDLYSPYSPYNRLGGHIFQGILLHANLGNFSVFSVGEEGSSVAIHTSVILA
jgi:hypothetical protein